MRRYFRDDAFYAAELARLGVENDPSVFGAEGEYARAMQERLKEEIKDTVEPSRVARRVGVWCCCWVELLLLVLLLLLVGAGGPGGDGGGGGGGNIVVVGPSML